MDERPVGRRFAQRRCRDPFVVQQPSRRHDILPKVLLPRTVGGGGRDDELVAPLPGLKLRQLGGLVELHPHLALHLHALGRRRWHLE